MLAILSQGSQLFDILLSTTKQKLTNANYIGIETDFVTNIITVQNVAVIQAEVHQRLGVGASKVQSWYS